MSEESSIKIEVQSDKVSALDLQNNQHKLLQEVVMNCVCLSFSLSLSLSLSLAKRLLTHFSTHTNALRIAYTVANS